MKSQISERTQQMLQTALGPKILDYLEQKSIIEIMLNPDGWVFVDDLNKGKYKTDILIQPEQAENIIKLIASSKNIIINKSNPILSAELPIDRSRFQGWLPPISMNPCFSIRKRAIQRFSLDDYLASKQISKSHYNYLKSAIQNRKNIIIIGGTGSGKTTFANALLSELDQSKDRVLILEDLSELQTQIQDHVFLETTETISMRDLVKGSLRMRPDRIIIGEVRDGAALEMLKAWNTGHPGGICTLHANNLNSALFRLEDLIQEVVVTPSKYLITESIDILIHIQKNKSGLRCITDVACLEGFDQNGYQLKSIK